MRTYFPVITLLLLLLRPLAADAATPLALDLHARPVDQLAGPGVQVVVLIFASTDCPISNRYVPEIARLNREYSHRGVRIWWVYPNPEDTNPIVTRHNHDFAITEPTLVDTQQHLVHLAHATVTPEAAVFTVSGSALHEIYHGRIDDRYLSIGTERPQPGQHDLESAITSALAGKPVVRPAEPPVGCAIVPLDQAAK